MPETKFDPVLWIEGILDLPEMPLTPSQIVEAVRIVSEAAEEMEQISERVRLNLIEIIGDMPENLAGESSVFADLYFASQETGEDEAEENLE